jgi:DNA-binding transcriptional regulator/RsmH inhibitor MraZ
MNCRTRKSSAHSNDTQITQELAFEGRLRELMREIQSKRKELGTRPDQEVRVTIPAEFMAYAPMLKRKVLAREIVEGAQLEVAL